MEHICHLNPFRYRGYIYDEETGFYYLTSRYYDPEVRRFINAYVTATITVGLENFAQYNLFAYCFNNPVNMYDSLGTFAEWLDENIIQPIVTICDDIKADIDNFDWDNKSEQVILDSNYFSAYKNVFVIRISGDRSGSFGVIFLTHESNDRDYPKDVVRHKYGHTEQFQELGLIDYLMGIGIPSVLNYGEGDYYDKPWKSIADVYGGVRSRIHTQEEVDEGFDYLERIKTKGPLTWYSMY